MLRIERVLIDRLSGHFLRRTAFPVSNRLCRNSDLSRRNSSSASSSPSVRSNLHLRRDPHAGDHSRTSFGYDATVHDAASRMIRWILIGGATKTGTASTTAEGGRVVQTMSGKRSCLERRRRRRL
ncbi:hypothetical protein Bca52824_079578 [Brassica carinata]|uniref:Uncharacterized protein n=1 Tax=Brassica carinata TaxID=52824 RepID=A0A8X7PXP6_BRACI|nr:hypothetical protein Bca52824_079578 [Brassica carinata]